MDTQRMVQCQCYCCAEGWSWAMAVDFFRRGEGGWREKGGWKGGWKGRGEGREEREGGPAAQVLSSCEAAQTLRPRAPRPAGHGEEGAASERKDAG